VSRLLKDEIIRTKKNEERMTRRNASTLPVRPLYLKRRWSLAFTWHGKADKWLDSAAAALAVSPLSGSHTPSASRPSTPGPPADRAVSPRKRGRPVRPGEQRQSDQPNLPPRSSWDLRPRPRFRGKTHCWALFGCV